MHIIIWKLLFCFFFSELRLVGMRYSSVFQNVSHLVSISKVLYVLWGTTSSGSRVVVVIFTKNIMWSRNYGDDLSQYLPTFISSFIDELYYSRGLCCWLRAGIFSLHIIYSLDKYLFKVNKSGDRRMTGDSVYCFYNRL